MQVTAKTLEKLGFRKIPWKEQGKREIAYQYKTVTLTQYTFREGFFYSSCGEDTPISSEEHLLAVVETLHGESLNASGDLPK